MAIVSKSFFAGITITIPTLCYVWMDFNFKLGIPYTLPTDYQKTTFVPTTRQVSILWLGVNCTKLFLRSFYARRSQKGKNSVKLSVSFLRFWDLHALKLQVKWWWHWPQLLIFFQGAERVVMQANGDMVLSNTEMAVQWSSRSNNNSGAFLVSISPSISYLIFKARQFRIKNNFSH